MSLLNQLRIRYIKPNVSKNIFIQFSGVLSHTFKANLAILRIKKSYYIALSTISKHLTT